MDDTVRVNDRLTLNLGVRYDHNTARIPDLDVRDQQGNPTGETIPGRDLYTWNVFAPRLGFNLKLTDDGKTVAAGPLWPLLPGDRDRRVLERRSASRPT